MKEFSKIIIVAFTVVWLLAVIAGGVYVFMYKEYLPEWLSVVSIPMTAGLVGYFCKAGFENVKKIKNSINER